MAEPGTTDHQCIFWAVRDGYCNRHHPANRIKILRRKEQRLKRQLSDVQAELARMPAILDAAEFENAS